MKCILSQNVKHFVLGFSALSTLNLNRKCAYDTTGIKTKKVQVGNDQEMAHSERNSHYINRGVGKN